MLDLWESSPDERREATRELAQAQALVEDLAATYAGSGSELVLGVLWLAAASGDAAFALEITRRVIAERPNDRNAHYVLVGLLQELGRSDEAAAVVAQWLARRTDPDPVLQKRATERIYGDVGWPEARGLFVRGEPGERALDYAVARAAAPS